MQLAIENIFLDRDGTVIEELHYLSDPKQVRLYPGAGRALHDLTAQGCRLYLVTNQSGIGRGYFTKADYTKVQHRVHTLLGEFGVKISAEAFCPHAPDEGCSCRKPGAGLFDFLTTGNNIDPARSVVIGDKNSDIGFGRSCGFKATILVLTGHGIDQARSLGLPELQKDWLELPPPRGSHNPDLLARDLAAACAWITQRNASLPPGDVRP